MLSRLLAFVIRTHIWVREVVFRMLIVLYPRKLYLVSISHFPSTHNGHPKALESYSFSYPKMKQSFIIASLDARQLRDKMTPEEWRSDGPKWDMVKLLARPVISSSHNGAVNDSSPSLGYVPQSIPCMFRLILKS